MIDEWRPQPISVVKGACYISKQQNAAGAGKFEYADVVAGGLRRPHAVYPFSRGQRQRAKEGVLLMRVSEIEQVHASPTT